MRNSKTNTIIFGLVFLVTGFLNAQNRYYDYRDRTPGDKLHILYMAGGSWHDHLGVASVLRRFLEVRHEYHITYTEDFGVFTRPLEAYDVILMNGMPNSMTDEQFNGFSDAIKKGKPLLGLHSATAALKRDNDHKAIYTSIIGADFAKHPPIHTFPVEVKESEHPIVQNIGNFTIYDEMYFFKDFADGSYTIIQAEHEEKKTPIAWTRRYGKGKVFYTSLGHGVGAATNRHFQQIILNALEWLLEE